MRARISRRLLPLFLALLCITVLGSALPVEGKGSFCPGLCRESLGVSDAFDSVIYE